MSYWFSLGPVSAIEFLQYLAWVNLLSEELMIYVSFGFALFVFFLLL